MHVGERSALIGVPVALQSAPGPRQCSIDTNHRRLGFRSDRDGLDPTSTAWSSGGQRRPQRQVGRCDQIAGLNRVEGLRPAQGLPGDAGRGAERYGADTAFCVSGSEHRQPGAWPVEARRIGDRHEPEPALREPLSPDRPRLRVPLVRHGSLSGVQLQDRRETG
jgi:hypothetical protein